MGSSPAALEARAERQLVRLAQGRGTDAHEAMAELVVRIGSPIVGSQVKRFRLRADQRDDASQAGYAGFIGAVRRHDSSREVAFEHVAKRRVRDAILEELGVARPQLHVVSAGADLPDRAAEELLEARETAAIVRTFVDGLTAVQREVVEAVYWDGFSQAEVARARGISRAAVTKTLNRVYAGGRVALAALRPAEGVR